MRYWALQYGPWIEILEPESLRNRIIDDIQDMIRRYSD
ncbi:MAG: WYL domain-containing protein [Butyrivibrio sp.]|nr:WYL domain-containing protein [Butyrivibrio sp.]